MKYMGSKNRIAKEILPIILRDKKPDQWYVEPFVGGFNIIDKVFGNRIANDINPYVIALFKAIQGGWEPPDEVSNELWRNVKENKDSYEPAMVGFVGFGCSYGGRWFEGYARGNKPNGEPRNYCAESKRNIMKQMVAIQGIELYCMDYKELEGHLYDQSIIYCDPPYRNEKHYDSAINHDDFWQWCRQMIDRGHSVFVSEYSAPEDFVSVWSKEISTKLNKDGARYHTENLFVHKNSVKETPINSIYDI